MKGSQSINDLSSFPEPSQQGNTLPRSRGKEQTAVVVEKRHQPSKRRIKPRRPVSLHVEALQRSMTGHSGGGGLSPTGDDCPQLAVGCGTLAGMGDKHSVPHQSALTGDGGAESDDTVLGDLGESSSSGFVGSEVLVQQQSPCPSSLVSSAQFILNSPCSNFPTLAVTPELYRVGEEEDDNLKVEEEDLDRFSEDSLAESPGKQRRVSKRLAELARKIEQEDSLAMVDSLATDTVVPLDSLPGNLNLANVEPDSLLPVPSLALVDSLMPTAVEDASCLPLDSLLPDTGRLTEDSGLPADSLFPTDSCPDEDSLLPVVDDMPTFTEQLTEINAALKDIEDHQERINLRVELSKLQRELKEMEKKDNFNLDTSSTNSPSRAKWRPMDVQIATDDLTCNPEMSFSYDNMAPLLDCYKSSSPPLPSNQPLLPPPSPQIRDKGYSPDSSSEEEEEEGEEGASEVLQSQLPLPVKAKLPPPVPNLPLLQEKPEPKPKPTLLTGSSPVSMKGVRDLQPAHPGPLGMTSMWIPSINSNPSPAASLSSSRSSLASPLTTSRSSLSSTRAPPSPRTPRLRPRTNTGPTPNAPSLLSKRLSLLTPVLPDKSSPGLATTVRSISSALCRLGWTLN